MTKFKFQLFLAVLVGFAGLFAVCPDQTNTAPTKTTAPTVSTGFDDGKAAYNRGDYAVAYKEFKGLAEHGNATAQSFLGWMYDKGRGVPQNYAEAVKWYRKAADQGNTGAQSNLGAKYYLGQGVPQDYAEALEWFRKAAERRDVFAQFSLGGMYYFGLGVPQDYVQAHMWFNLSAAQGHEDAKKCRDLLAEKMTPAQITEAQGLAAEWKPKSHD